MQHFGTQATVRVTLITDALITDALTGKHAILSTLAEEHGPLVHNDVVLEATSTDQELLGAALLRPCGGTCANLLLPHAKPPSPAAVRLLARGAAEAAASRGIQLVQCVSPHPHLHTPLELTGFRKLTTMLTLVQEAPDLPTCRLPAIQLQRCQATDEYEFTRRLAETFEASCDFPELSRFQTAQDVVREVPVKGRFWIYHHEQPIGTLLLRGEPTDAQLELAYLGILPALRARGWGQCAVRELLAWALQLNPNARIVAGVDARNEPAIRMYSNLGFVTVSEHPVHCFEVPSNA